jgi:hypothetical protein
VTDLIFLHETRGQPGTVQLTPLVIPRCQHHNFACYRWHGCFPLSARTHRVFHPPQRRTKTWHWRQRNSFRSVSALNIQQLFVSARSESMSLDFTSFPLQV